MRLHQDALQHTQPFLQATALLLRFGAGVLRLLLGVREAGAAPAHGVQILRFEIEVLTSIFVFHLGRAVVALHAIYPHSLVET